MKCYKCGSTDNVIWQKFGENGREIAICPKCEWKHFITHVDTKNLSSYDKQYVAKEKEKLSV